MSRSGRIPIAIPENTEIKIEEGVIFAKGKLGELSFSFKMMQKLKLRIIVFLLPKVAKVNITQECGVL